MFWYETCLVHYYYNKDCHYYSSLLNFSAYTYTFCNVKCSNSSLLMRNAACWVEVLYTRGCWVMQGAAVTDMCKCLEEVWIQDTCPSVSTHTTVQDSGGNKVYSYSLLVHFGLRSQLSIPFGLCSLCSSFSDIQKYNFHNSRTVPV